MNLLVFVGVLILGYLIGAIPFGFLIVKLFKNEDVRDIQSGRTGGTNTMRAAGFWAGFATAILDIAKNALVVILAQKIAPGALYLHILAGIIGVIGHNYSIYISRREEDGKWKFHGGAGGSVALGGAIGLWSWNALIIIAIAAAIFYFIGYASVTTMSVAVIATIVFAIRAYMGLGPWEYLIYGIATFGLLVWALRPNILRLMEGTERLHGFRAQMRRRKEKQHNS